MKATKELWVALHLVVKIAQITANLQAVSRSFSDTNVLCILNGNERIYNLSSIAKRSGFESQPFGGFAWDVAIKMAAMNRGHDSYPSLFILKLHFKSFTNLNIVCPCIVYTFLLIYSQYPQKEAWVITEQKSRFKLTFLRAACRF